MLNPNLAKKTTEEIVSRYLDDDLATFVLNNFVIALNNILQDLSLSHLMLGEAFFCWKFNANYF